MDMSESLLLATPFDRLANFFNPSQPRETYNDAEIDEIANLLERCGHAATKCPRTYIILRTIGELDLLGRLLNEGFTDQLLPLEPQGLPQFLSPSVKARIVQKQSIVLTKSLDLEQGRHRHFLPGEAQPFDILSCLGSGSYSQVDRIESKTSFRQYALKRIRRRAAFGNNSKESLRRFLSEIQIVKNLKHVHIVKYIGSYTDKTYLGLVMSPIADMDLAAYLDQTSAQVEAVVLKRAESSTLLQREHGLAAEMCATLRTYFGCLAAALAHLHDRSVRHKDIKPQNILVNKGNILLADFGLSRDFADDIGSTTSGITPNTPRYSPPEVAAYGARNTSADIWSLGCVFFEMTAALHGYNIDWIKRYLTANHTCSPHFYANHEASSQLISEWEVAWPPTERRPLEWIRSMMQLDRFSRPTAASILEMITYPTELNLAPTVFCGVCCVPGQESDSEDSLVDDHTVLSMEAQETIDASRDPREHGVVGGSQPPSQENETVKPTLTDSFRNDGRKNGNITIHELADSAQAPATETENAYGANGGKTQSEAPDTDISGHPTRIRLAHTSSSGGESGGGKSAKASTYKARGERTGSTQDNTSRIRYVINRWNYDDSEWEDIEDEPEKAKDAPDKAATYRRHMYADNERRVEFEEVEIHSQYLKILMIEIDEWWRDAVTEGAEVTVQSPFKPFVWNWDRYSKACETNESDAPPLKAARKDLKDLMQLIKTSTGLKSYFRSRDQLKISKKIKFEHLWTLFGHGSEVYARSYMNDLQMFEVKGYTVSSHKSGSFKVSCAAFDWDGSKFSSYTYSFYIDEFDGEKPISSLDVFPTEFFYNQDGKYDDSQLRQQLLERGRRYCELCFKEPMQCEYEGSTIVTRPDLVSITSEGRGADTQFSYSDPRLANQDGEEVSVNTIDIKGKQSRVIIDSYAFLKLASNTMKRGDMPPLGEKVPSSERDCVCAICKSSPLQQRRPELGLGPSLQDLNNAFAEDESRLLFLPPRLLGFALKQREWGQFLVDNLSSINSANARQYPEPFWDELQLERESKELLITSVKYHKARGPRKLGQEIDGICANAFDVTEGKGQRLVILLHGPPGIGKTLTAETVALATGRPLLTVSVADTGVEAHEAEPKLINILTYAERWDALLLMEEADIFVEGWKKADWSHRPLVSVFLRCLEDYDGILILTTNRVRSIDMAVQSCINLFIQYHDLSAKQRLGIYMNMLKHIPDEEMEDRRALEKELKYSPLTKTSNKKNGRQIRHIVQAARALAQSKGKLLALEHLTAVDETTSNFIASMEELLRAESEVGDEE